MNLHISIVYGILVFFASLNTSSSHRRFRRQNNNLQSIHSKTPSGSIPGTAYYGIGSDPNWGSHIARPNRPGGGGVIPISYNPNSEFYRYLINPSHSHQSPNYAYNKHQGWQDVYATYNRPINQYYNRYEPGNQGWYLTGGDHWYNSGQSLLVNHCLLFFIVFGFFLCK